MEYLNQQFGAERLKSVPEANSHVPGHRRVFEREGETYEEISFLYEPMERYKDDISRLDVVIGHKKQTLYEAREKLKAHVATGISAMHVLEDDIANKMVFMKKELDHFEIIRETTVQLINLLAKQDTIERNLLDTLPTDKEN